MARVSIEDVAQLYQTALCNRIPINNSEFTNEMRIIKKLLEAFKRDYL